MPLGICLPSQIIMSASLCSADLVQLPDSHMVIFVVCSPLQGHLPLSAAAALHPAMVLPLDPVEMADLWSRRQVRIFGDCHKGLMALSLSAAMQPDVNAA